MTHGAAELVAIGSELLDPWHTDTNGAWLSRRLGERGIPVRFRTVVGDALEDLKETFRIAVSRSDLVVATGGLGPTIDDRTRDAVADLLGLPLARDEDLVRGLEERFRRHALPMPPQNLSQAMVPRGAVVLPNPVGTAPGLWIRSGRAEIVLLPGVPAEMRRIFEDSVLSRLASSGDPFVYRVIKIAGLGESEVDRRLDDIARGTGAVDWTILAAPGQVEIHLRERVRRGDRPAGIERLDAAIVASLGPRVFSRDDQTLESVVGELLVERGHSLATAESVTGGGIARLVTSVPGASRYFRGAAVVYAEEAKRSLLGVPATTLETHGAVSAPTAAAMARGARRLFASTWALSATGYAGPEGGGPDRPAGTVVLGLAGPEREVTREIRWPGERETVRSRAARGSLDLLRRALIGAEP